MAGRLIAGPGVCKKRLTLGNTEGMTFGELGERTLITKGTLTGVIDRMEARGWIERVPLESDRRCTLAVLTPEGQELFESVFPRHIASLKERFDRMDPEQREEARQMLRQVRELFGPTEGAVFFSPKRTDTNK